jgi:SAM-dependent methyltransferase
MFAFDDRVAERYNAQRAHPPEVSRQVGAALTAIAGPDAPALEIGVGTGRIAFPLSAAGTRVFGIDVSMEMLRNVSEKAYRRLYVLQGDMHHLSFPTNAFGTVLAVHVLHLARDWRMVMEEISRVLQPGGAFVQGDDWMDPRSVIGLLRDELRRLAIEHSPDLMPPSAGIDKMELLRELGGGELEERVVAEWTFSMSPAERLRMYERRMDAESWFLPEPLFNKLYAGLREFAARQWDDLDEPQPVTRRFTLKVMRGDWR